MTHERNEDAQKTPKDEQRTPAVLFQKLNDRFHFTTDGAARFENKLCPFWCEDFFTFKFTLNDIVFVNPPYSEGKIKKFLQHGYYETLRTDCTMVFLLPADISTKWWDYCMFAAEWIRIRGRVTFNHADGTPIKGSPKFGSMVVVFNKKQKKEQAGKILVSEMRWR